MDACLCLKRAHKQKLAQHFKSTTHQFKKQRILKKKYTYTWVTSHSYTPVTYVTLPINYVSAEKTVRTGHHAHSVAWFFFFPLNKIQWVEQPISPQSFFLAFNKGWLVFQIPPGGHLVSTFSCVLTITKQCFFSEHSSEDMYLLCFSHTHTKLFWPHCVGLWNQSSLIRDQTCTPCNDGQRLNHWTTREVPHKLLLF